MKNLYTTPHHSEQSILKGICPDCEGPMRVWTAAEIQEAKDDMGLATDEDFCDVCDKCFTNYFPDKGRHLGANLMALLLST